MALLATEGVLLPRFQERVPVHDYMGPQGVGCSQPELVVCQESAFGCLMVIARNRRFARPSENGPAW